MSSLEEKFLCNMCNYEAASQHILARHVAIAHSAKVFSCPLCPFVSRYQANLYRHKRVIHGIRRTSTCELCGYVAPNEASLCYHKESFHQQVVAKEKKHYENQKEILLEGEYHKSRGGNVNNKESLPLQISLPTKRKDKSDKVMNKDFGSSLCNSANNTAATESFENSLELLEEASFFDSIPSTSVASSLGGSELGPVRIRRKYTCELCNLVTINPREFLYHRQQVHRERITVYECPYCLYASKHFQKLQRHCGMVHQKVLNPLVGNKLKDVENFTMMNKPVETEQSKEYSEQRTGVRMESIALNCIKEDYQCSKCHFRAKSKMILIQHEKISHLKKKFFRCLQCDYVTNEKARYTKHCKYHSLPKVKCKFCNFTTTYKWNLDRHMKNHLHDEMFKCEKCSYTCHSEQALKSHTLQHHDSSLGDQMSVIEKNPRINSGNEEEKSTITEEQQPGSSKETCNSQSIQKNTSTTVTEEKNIDTSDSNFSAKEGKVYKKNFKCSHCSYHAAWLSDVKKHESCHISKKLHSCPICGMGFDLLSSLAHHLRHQHEDSDQASSIAYVIEMVSSGQANKKMPILKTLLSECLGEEMQSSSIVQQASDSSENSLPSSSYNMMQMQNPRMSASLQNFKSDKPMPTCGVCGYKTRWMSELEKHRRVHSGEKPFKCTYCNYRCKWRGDLTRHIQKHHPEKSIGPLVNKKPVLKMKIKNPRSSLPIISSYITSENVSKPETVENKDQGKPSTFNVEDVSHMQPTSLKKSNVEISVNQDMPLDLSISSKRLNSKIQEESSGENVPGKYLKTCSDAEEASEDSVKNTKTEVKGGVKTKIVKKYQCAYCPFITRTASRFHVHIVQHFNRKPFMCSACCYKSNWQWDITKHIKMKMVKDGTHQGATCLLTDETGRRNYEKYKDFLIEVPLEMKSLKNKDCVLSDSTESFDANEYSVNSDEDSPELNGNMVNIVVTPDIPFPVEDFNEQVSQVDPSTTESTVTPETKYFYCSHCNFQHIAKKVVVSHMAVHAGLKPFRCRSCGLVSNWRHVILRHIKSRHGGNLEDLEERITVSQQGRNLYLSEVHSGDKDFSFRNEPTSELLSCQVCPYTCVKHSHMKLHMKQHQPREGAVFKCLHCPYYVKFRKPLRRHMKLHTEASENYQASQQHHSLENESTKLTHSKNKTEINQNVVQVTKSCLPRKPATHIYTGIAAMFKKYSCDGCPYKTDNRSQFLYHKQFHRPNSLAPHRCTVCSYWAKRQHLIIQHMKVHKDDNSSEPSQTKPDQKDKEKQAEKPSDDKPEAGKIKMYKCRYCPMTSKHRTNMLSHEAMHEKDSPSKFACPLCNYHCNSLGVLSGHLKLHQESEVDQFLNSASRGVERWNKKKYMSLTQNHMDTNMSSANTSDQLGAASSQESLTVRKKVFSYFCTKCPAVFKSTADFKIHKSFHGSDYPFSCPHCDYRAKHKPHLHKHFFVHTPAYAAKREASYGPPVEKSQENNSVQEQTLALEDNVHIESQVDNTKSTLGKNPNSISQLLLHEETETRSFCNRHDIQSSEKLHKCLFCPANFYKQSTFQFHMQLHDGNGSLACSSCSYAVDSIDNLTTHVRLHSKDSHIFKKVESKSQTIHSCPKCPAVFNKIARYERHITLHGQSNRYTCDKCDYSVKFAANLQKHKPVHDRGHTQICIKNVSSLFNKEPELLKVQPSLIEHTSFQVDEISEEREKKLFHCDRCPYVNQRKDAVQSHQKRHGATGVSCPYCDYTTMQPSCLRDHIKCHLQPQSFLKAQSFLKYDSMEIWIVEEETKDLFFRDRGQSFTDNRFLSPFEEALIESPSNSNVVIKESDESCEEHVKKVGKIRGERSSVTEEETVIKMDLPIEGEGANKSILTVVVPNEIENKIKVIKDALSQHNKLEVVLTDVLENVFMNHPEKEKYEVSNKDGDKKNSEENYNENGHIEQGVGKSEKLQESKCAKNYHTESQHMQNDEQLCSMDQHLNETDKKTDIYELTNYVYCESRKTRNQPELEQKESEKQQHNKNVQLEEKDKQLDLEYAEENTHKENSINQRTGVPDEQVEVKNRVKYKQEDNENLGRAKVFIQAELEHAEDNKQELDMDLESIEIANEPVLNVESYECENIVSQGSNDIKCTENYKKDFNLYLQGNEIYSQSELKDTKVYMQEVCQDAEKLANKLTDLSNNSSITDPLLPSTSFQAEEFKTT
ncbi:uncharacterized protein LOC143256804 [Tachypleus tridentatus]|uniref:uncharacterized protein LOC143256804 n=1 Tax=Tachypleus tridentatus TaxID=6853 RepID=UPI003FD2A319